MNIQVIAQENQVNKPPQILTLQEIQPTIDDPENSDKFIWIDFANPSQTYTQYLSQILNLHPMTSEDLTQINREKLEIFESYRFFCLDELQYDWTLSQLLIVQKGNKIFTFHSHPNQYQPNPSQNSNQNQENSLRCINNTIPRFTKKNQDQIKYRASWVAYSLIDEICNRHFYLVSTIADEIFNLDQAVLQPDYDAGDDTTLLQRVANFRKRISQVRDTLYTEEQVLNSFLKAEKDKNPNHELIAYLRDVKDHVEVMHRKIRTSSDLLNQINTTYMTRIQIEIGQHGEVLNHAINRFSAVATIFLPLTAMTSLWGMNVPVPGETSENLTPFLTIAICLTVFAITTAIFFRLKKWI